MTAPLRRLADRYGLEVCAALSEGVDVLGARQAASAARVMAETGRRAGAYEAAFVGLVEAADHFNDRSRVKLVGETLLARI